MSQLHLMEKYVAVPTLLDETSHRQEFHSYSDTSRTVKPDLFLSKGQELSHCFDSYIGVGARHLVQVVQEGNFCYLQTSNS